MIQELTQKEVFIVCKRILDYGIEIALKDLHIFHIDQVRKFINSVKSHYDIMKMSDEEYKEVTNDSRMFYSGRHYLFTCNVGLEKELNYIYESFERWEYQNELNDLKEKAKSTKELIDKIFEENEKRKLEKLKEENSVKNDEEPNSEIIILKADGTKFSLSQIALIYLYKGEPITNYNNNTIVKKYGWISGHKLNQHYSIFLKNRLITKNLSYRELENRIKLIQSIIEYLPNDKQSKANDEIKKLEVDLDSKEDY
jgi:hypothetical protein